MVDLEKLISAANVWTYLLDSCNRKTDKPKQAEMHLDKNFDLSDRLNKIFILQNFHSENKYES